MGKWTRRALFAVAGLTGCAISDPMVRVTMQPAESTRPTISPEQFESLRDEVGLSNLISLVASGAPALKLEPAINNWLTASFTAHRAHIARLLSADPLLPKAKPDFHEPKVHLTPPATATAALASIQKMAAEVSERHLSRALKHSSTDQPSALFHLSMALLASNSATPGTPPVVGAGAPAPFAPSAPGPAIGVVLTRTWALIYGLETALGRLQQDTPLFKDGLERLGAAKQLRDDLLTLETLRNPPEQFSSYPLGMIGTPEQITATWAGLELDLLGAWARATAAAKAPDAANYAAAALAQVAHIRHWKGALPSWPGWV